MNYRYEINESILRLTDFAKYFYRDEEREKEVSFRVFTSRRVKVHFTLEKKKKRKVKVKVREKLCNEM